MRLRLPPFRFSFKQLKFASLRAKLVLAFLAVALIPLMLISALNRHTAIVILTRNANQSLATAAIQTELRLDTFIQTNLDAVRVESQIPGLSRYLKLPLDRQLGSPEELEVSAILRGLTRRDPLNVLSYSLLNLQGVTVFDTNTPDIRQNKSDADYFQQALALKFPYVSPVRLSAEDGLKSLYFSSPVRDAVGESLGVLVVRYNAQVIQQIVNQSINSAGDQSYAVVLDDYHIRIADGSGENRQFTSLMPLSAEVIKTLQSQHRLPQLPAEQLTTHQADFDQVLNQVVCPAGKTCAPIYGTVKVARSIARQKRVAVVKLQTRPWFVVFCQPETAFLAPIRAQVWVEITWGIGIAVGVIIAALLIARWLSKPIASLAEGVSQFTSGNLEARVQLRSRDEIGVLAANFNDMAEQVGKLLKGLEDRTVELEGSRYITFAVSELSKSILDGDRLLQEATKLVQEGFAVSYVQIYLWDEANTQLQLKASAGGVDEVQKHQISLSWDWSLVAIAARRFQTQVCHNLAHDLAPSASQPSPSRSGSEVAVPLISRGMLLGVLDIRDNSTHRFNENDQETFNTLAGQIATALENARLFQAIHSTEAQYRDKVKELEQTLQALQQAQANLVQSEKMSSLGQLVAGVAHEINNPINFIYANLTYVNQYQVDLFKLLELYQHHYPSPPAEIQAEQDNIDLAFLTQDFSQILTSMKVGAERVRKIVLSLRNFSRLDESEIKPVDIHEGIESTLVMLQSQLKESNKRSAIEIIKEYGSLPLVECYAGQLNQVFMNLLVNAIDSLEASAALSKSQSSASMQSKTQTQTQTQTQPPKSEPLQISIKTEVLNRNVIIRISDNGIGMDEATRHKLFDPFFTTKEVGKGTGLGLSVSYQIVTERHQGYLTCNSQMGMGAEFVVQIPIASSALQAVAESGKK